MSRWIAFFGKLDQAGRIAENVALMAVLAGMVVVAFLQIIFREVFDTGVFWANELIRLMVLWLAREGRRRDSAALRANARHLRTDVITSLGVFEFPRERALLTALHPGADLETVVLPYHLDSLKQAAGVAAALCSAEHVTPKHLNVKELQDTLCLMGVRLFPPSTVEKDGRSG